jgi:hypothetical protein
VTLRARWVMITAQGVRAAEVAARNQAAAREVANELVSAELPPPTEQLPRPHSVTTPLIVNQAAAREVANELVSAELPPPTEQLPRPHSVTTPLIASNDTCSPRRTWSDSSNPPQSGQVASHAQEPAASPAELLRHRKLAAPSPRLGGVTRSGRVGPLHPPTLDHTYRLR